MKEKYTRKDYLELLGLRNDATDDEIKIAYRKLAKKCHPDLDNKNPEASKNFIRLNKIYDDLLKDKPKKIVNKSKSPINKNDIGSFFDSVLNHFKKLFDFENFDSHNNFIENPEPFVDLRKIIRDRKRRDLF